MQKQLVQLRSKNESLVVEMDQKISEINELIESEKFLSLELEDRENMIAGLQVHANSKDELDKLKEEKMDLLERIEEREDMLKSLQDESVEKKGEVEKLRDQLESKEREIAMMISQAEELDGLLSRADQDVHASREKVAALEKEIDEIRKNSSQIGGEAQKERDKLAAEMARLDSLLKATTVNSDTLANQLREQISSLQLQVENLKQSESISENRIKILTDEKNLLTTKLAAASASTTKTTSSPKSKINALEKELTLMKRALGREENDSSYDTSLTGNRENTEEEDDGVTPSPAPLTENVLKAENMFHDAVDLCGEASFGEAVALLEQASAILSRLSKSEISKNDATTLKILESDIYGQLGVAFQSLSQVAEAIEAYMTAVDVDPEAHACHANLAVLLHHQSRLKEAETHAKIAIELAPEIDEYTALLSQIKSFTPIATSGGGGGGYSSNKFRASTNW